MWAYKYVILIKKRKWTILLYGRCLPLHWQWSDEMNFRYDNAVLLRWCVDSWCWQTQTLWKELKQSRNPQNIAPVWYLLLYLSGGCQPWMSRVQCHPCPSLLPWGRWVQGIHWGCCSWGRAVAGPHRQQRHLGEVHWDREMARKTNLGWDSHQNTTCQAAPTLQRMCSPWPPTATFFWKTELSSLFFTPTVMTPGILQGILAEQPCSSEHP